MRSMAAARRVCSRGVAALGRASVAALGVALAVALAGCGAGGLGDGIENIAHSITGGGDSSPGVTMSSKERAAAQEILVRVNAERAKAGVQALTWDEGAAQVAYTHAVDMDRRGF